MGKVSKLVFMLCLCSQVHSSDVGVSLSTKSVEGYSLKRAHFPVIKSTQPLAYEVVEGLQKGDSSKLAETFA